MRPSPISSAERRALWEIRQRYAVTGSPPRRLPARRTMAPPPSRGGPPPIRRAGLPPPPLTPPAGRGFAPRRSAARWTARLVGIVVLLLLFIGGVFGYKILAASNKITTTERSLIGQLSDLLFKQDNRLDGEAEGRINVLLIAIGGEGHAGENLADTIMVASLKPDTHEAALLSIPRDLYVQVPGDEYYTKLNAVHAYGEDRRKDTGPELLRTKVAEVTGLPLNYFGRIDFIAFKHIVDALGGVDITIANSFLDYWHNIAFSAGTERMNGDRALAFVRARYIEGSEGGDFKRAQRQQQLLSAIMEKIFATDSALDFSALYSILTAVEDNVRTDMQLRELKRLYELARTIDRNQVHAVVLGSGASGPLVGTTELLGGSPASVLKTRTGDYGEVHEIARNLFSPETRTALAQSATETPSLTPTPEPPQELAKPTVEIRNGTNINGLAKRTADRLKAEDYTVTAVGNAGNRATERTTIYALKLSEEAAEGTKILAALFNAATDSGLPEGEPESNADVLIILGPDASTPAPTPSP